MSNETLSITLSKEEVKRCFDFAEKFTSISEQKSNLDFGHHKLSRKLIDAIADCTLGKIGELAFQKICFDLGFIIDVDFEITSGRHEIDFGQDVSGIKDDNNLLVPLPRIDIKSTKKHSQWLLLEDHKQWASIIVYMSADLPKEIETDLSSFNESVDCKFEGFAYMGDFFDAEGQPWFHFKSGNMLLNPLMLNCMYEKALKKYGQVSNKNQLKEFFESCKVNITKEYMGGRLKCPNQMGLPKSFLRSSERDLVDLMTLVKSVSVSTQDWSDSLIEPLVNWTLHMSKLPKNLRKHSN